MAKTRRKAKLSKPAAPTRRMHFIPEHAAAHNPPLKQTHLIDLTKANKGTVSRWYAGSDPDEPYLSILVEIFGLKTPQDLYKTPQEVRLLKLGEKFDRLLGGRPQEDEKRAEDILRAYFAGRDVA